MRSLKPPTLLKQPQHALPIALATALAFTLAAALAFALTIAV